MIVTFPFLFQFSQAQLGGMLMDNIHLFKHDVRSENILQLLKGPDVMNIKSNDLIEIVLSCKYQKIKNNFCMGC